MRLGCHVPSSNPSLDSFLQGNSKLGVPASWADQVKRLHLPHKPDTSCLLLSQSIALRTGLPQLTCH